MLVFLILVTLAVAHPQIKRVILNTVDTADSVHKFTKK